MLKGKTNDIDLHIKALRRMRRDLGELIGAAESFDPQECGSDQEVCRIIKRT